MTFSPRAAWVCLALTLSAPAWADEGAELVATGKRHLEAGEFRDATSALRKAQQVKAEGAEALLKLSRALGSAEQRLKRRRLPEAAGDLKAAAAVDPKHPQLRRLADELARFDAILAAKGSLPGEAMTRRTKHFLIHHHQPYLATKVARAAEEHLREVLAGIRLPSRRAVKLKTMHLRVYRGRAEYQRNARGFGGVSAGMVVSATEMLTFQDAVLGLLKHELTHMVIHGLLPNMPLWVHEGLASGGYRQAAGDEYTRALRHLENDEFLTLAELFAVPSMKEFKIPRAAFYLQSRLLCEFLLVAVGDLERFHAFGREVRTRALSGVKEWAKTQKGRRLSVDPLKFVNAVVPELIAKHYGYSDLELLTEDLQRYLKHRVREAALQAKERPPKADFPARTTLRTENLVIFASGAKKNASPLAELGQRVHDTLYRELWRADVLFPRRVKVYLFERRSEYAAYLKARGMRVEQGKHGALPHFNPRLGAACLYRARVGTDYLHQTLAHEVTHALTWNLVRRAGARAPWLIEGIAHYVGLSIHKGTQQIPLGEIHETRKSKAASYLQVMFKQHKATPLSEFVGLPFGRLQSVPHHVEAWGVFHFLRHGKKGTLRPKLMAYLRAVQAGGPGGRKAFETHVGADLDDAFQSYVSGLEPD